MNPTIPTTGIGSIAETNRLLGGEYFNQTGESIRQFTPRITPGMDNVSAEDVPTTPINLSEPTPSTTSAGVTGANDAYIKSIGDILKTDEEEKQKEADEQRGKVKEIFDKITGLQEEKQKAIGDKNDPGTPAWQKEQARQLGLEFDKVQRSQLNELRELDLREGLSVSGKATIRQGINNRYAMDSADIQLKYHIAQSDYNSSIDTLNTKFELELEPLKTRLDYERDIYNQVSDDLSKSEDRELNFLINQHETEIANLREDKKEIASIFETLQKENPDALRNNPQLAVALSNAKDGMSAIQLLAQNGISLANPLDIENKRLTNEKLRADIAETKAGTTATITRTDANGNPLPPNAQDRALEIILGSGKFTKDQVRLVTQAINEGEDPFVVIKNQAKSILGSAGETKLTQYEIAESTLADIGAQIEQFYALGGRTGIFTGNFEKVVNKLGQVVDPRLVTLATQIQGNIQVYRNAISGTAYSTQEGQDIQSIFPGINKGEELNTAILKGRETLFNSVIDATYRTALGSAYDELKNASLGIPTAGGGDSNSNDPLGLFSL